MWSSAWIRRSDCKYQLLPATAGRNQFRYSRVAHLLQPGEDLLTIHQYRQLTLLGTTLNFYGYFFKVLLKFSGKTCRQLLLSSGCTVLNQNLHKLLPPRWI